MIQHIIVLYNIYHFDTTYQYHWLFIICSLIFKQHTYVVVTFLYVNLFSSNIYMLVIYLFYVTQQTYIWYCSPWHMLFKKSHDMHKFFFWSAVRVDPCHHSTRYPSSQCHNGIIQVLWLGIMIMFQLHHRRETACHSQPSIRGCMTTW